MEIRCVGRKNLTGNNATRPQHRSTRSIPSKRLHALVSASTRHCATRAPANRLRTYPDSAGEHFRAGFDPRLCATALSRGLLTIDIRGATINPYLPCPARVTSSAPPCISTS